MRTRSPKDRPGPQAKYQKSKHITGGKRKPQKQSADFKSASWYERAALSIGASSKGLSTDA